MNLKKKYSGIGRALASLKINLCLLVALVSVSGQVQAAVEEQKVLEFSVVVNDVQAATLRYSQLLGLSQWELFDLAIDGTGNQVATRPQLRVARTQWQGVTFELIQPLADSSPVKSFLQERGEGLFSISVRGLPESLLSDSLFNASSSEGHYAKWVNTYQTLGIYLKSLSQQAPVKPWGRVNHPVSTNAAPAVFQLGIVVEDVKATAENYQRLVGLAPWMVVDFKAPHVSSAQYLGAVSDDDNPTFIQVAYGNWAGLQIELLAPITGPSPHRDFMITRGAGAHHLSFGPVSNHDELVNHYQKHGLALQMQSDNGGVGRTATYMASEAALGFVLELTRPFDGMGSLRPSGVIGMPVSASVK